VGHRTDKPAAGLNHVAHLWQDGEDVSWVELPSTEAPEQTGRGACVRLNPSSMARSPPAKVTGLQLAVGFAYPAGSFDKGWLRALRQDAS